MSVVVLDASAVTALAHADRIRRQRFAELRRTTDQPLVVPTTVVAEVLIGSGPRDARVNRLLAACVLVPLSEFLARRAAALRYRARRGSIVDASVVATAEASGGGVVLTSDIGDLDALTARSPIVSAVRIP